MLRFAKLQEQFAGDILPYDAAEQKINQFKERTLPLIRKNSDTDTFLQQFPNLYPSFEKIRQRIEEVHIEKQTVNINEKEMILPKTKELVSNLTETLVQGITYTSQISKVLLGSKNLFSQIEKENKEFVQENDKLRKENKNLIKEINEIEKTLDKITGNERREQETKLARLKDEMTKNEKALEEFQKNHLTFLSKEIEIPESTRKVPRSYILSRTFQEHCEKIQETQIKLKDTLETLKEEIYSMSEMNDELMLWIELDKSIAPLQNASFETSSWFTLPEIGKGKILIENILKEKNIEEEMEFKEVASGVIGVVGEVGIFKAKKFADDFSIQKKYKKQTEIRNLLKHPLSEQDRIEFEKLKISDQEFKNLERSYDNTILGKLNIFSPVLKSFELQAQKATKKNPITIKKGEKVAQKEVFEGINDQVVKKYFNEKESGLIKTKMKYFTPTQQKTILDSLAEALNLNTSIVSAKIELKKNIEETKELYASRISSEKNPQKITNIDLTSLSRKDSFEKDFNKFFTCGLDFKRYISIVKTLDATHLSAIKEEKKRIAYFSTKFTVAEMLEGDEETKTKSIVEFKEATMEFVSRLIPFENPEFQPYRKALDVILHSLDVQPTSIKMMETQDKFLEFLQKISSRQDLLQAIETAYGELAFFVHQYDHTRLVERLEDTLPVGDSSYRSDLSKGITNLRESDPLPLASVIREDDLEALGHMLESQAQDMEERVSAKRNVALELIKQLDPKKLPSEILRLRLQKKEDQELLDATLKSYRKGYFQENKELEAVLTAYLIDHTRLQTLTGLKDSAAASLSTLHELKSQREEVFKKLSKQTTEEQKKELENQLKVIDLRWSRESSKIRDFTERCQSTAHLESLGALQPHIRKILYLQYRQGMVLRKNQIETLQEIVSKPSLLKQLRMGLGKTSVILPFALEILASEGYNPIGMVPKALFGTNFNEMDATTRLIFELAGTQFLFSRDDVPSSLTPATLAHLTQKTKDFLQALENREFVLTTVESKASLDNKIAEIERSQKNAWNKWELVKKAPEDAKYAYQNLVNHQIALDALYQIKGVFEAEKTRIVIDEVDQVTHANYTVNSETGIKESLDQGLQDTVSTIFDMLRELPQLEQLRVEIAANNQFTLTDEQINQYIRIIGSTWLDKNWDTLSPIVQKKREETLNWFEGQESPFAVEEIMQMDIANETMLNSMRKALNSAFRSSLHHKFGLNGDFDPVHGAIGVPASQGVATSTTKYSDPLMQLSLAHIIAFYKPQGEGFLRSSAREVVVDLQREFDQIEQELSKQSMGIIQVASPLEDRFNQIKDALDKIQELFTEQETTGTIPSYADAISGLDTTSLLLRQKFAEQVAKRKLIYVSGDQITRPVQDALRGCNVIGLTGTATRNTEFLVTASNPQALEEIDKLGRQTTAEVLLRLSKALGDKGLDTEVNSYPSASKEAINKLKELTKNESGYNYIINQAGACDQLTLEEIVAQLHAADGRPIVHLSLDGKTKLVMIGGNSKALDKLNDDEKKEVKEKGFYYYHPPHVRGTHFDIPSGSKGVLLLSPTVNANERDQAAYRPRELGEGHQIEIWISEKQKQQLGDQGVTVAQVLKIHHEHTKNDEQEEQLSAYQLHVQGFLKKEIENVKKEIQALKPKENPLDESQQEKFIPFFEQKAMVSEMFEDFFMQDSGNKAYQRLLSQEIYGKGEIPTIESIDTLIKTQINRAEKLLDETKNLKPSKAAQLIETHLTQAIIYLEKVKTKLETKEFKQQLENQLPKKTISNASINATAETEAEEEAEAEQEVQVEVETESEINRYLLSKKFLGNIDQDLLSKLQSDFGQENTLTSLSPIFGKKERSRYVNDTWSEKIFISKRLQRHTQAAFGTMPPLTFVIAQTQDKTQSIVAVDQFEGGLLMSPSSIPTYHLPTNETLLGSSFSVKPTINIKGEADLIYSSAGTLTGNCEDQMTPSLKGELGLTMIELGYRQLSNNLWNDIISYWKNENDQKKQQIQLRFTQILKSDPSFLNLMGKKLWI